MLWKYCLPYAQYRQARGNRNAFHQGLLSRDLLRSLPGFLHERLLSTCHQRHGYKNPRPEIGDRATWSQHFKNHGYYTARVSKIFHMGVPGGNVEEGGHGADDEASWTERFNSPGPEWKAPGTGETLEGNPDGTLPVKGGNTFVVVEADGDDLVHSDGKTAAKAVELIKQPRDEPFFIGVGFVRPHVPFVAPREYYEDFLPYNKMILPEKQPGDWDDIPKPGINYKTSVNMKMDIRRQKKGAMAITPPSPSWTGKSVKCWTPWKPQARETKPLSFSLATMATTLVNTTFGPKLVCWTNRPAYLSYSVPGQEPAVCHSLVELLDLYPTLSKLCGLPNKAAYKAKTFH